MCAVAKFDSVFLRYNRQELRKTLALNPLRDINVCLTARIIIYKWHTLMYI